MLRRLFIGSTQALCNVRCGFVFRSFARSLVRLLVPCLYHFPLPAGAVSVYRLSVKQLFVCIDLSIYISIHSTQTSAYPSLFRSPFLFISLSLSERNSLSVFESMFFRDSLCLVQSAPSIEIVIEFVH
jgi:hypothetical protein